MVASNTSATWGQSTSQVAEGGNHLRDYPSTQWVAVDWLHFTSTMLTFEVEIKSTNLPEMHFLYTPLSAGNVGIIDTWKVDTQTIILVYPCSHRGPWFPCWIFIAQTSGVTLPVTLQWSPGCTNTRIPRGNPCRTLKTVSPAWRWIGQTESGTLMKINHHLKYCCSHHPTQLLVFGL